MLFLDSQGPHFYALKTVFEVVSLLFLHKKMPTFYGPLKIMQYNNKFKALAINKLGSYPLKSIIYKKNLNKEYLETP